MPAAWTVTRIPTDLGTTGERVSRYYRCEKVRLAGAIPACIFCEAYRQRRGE
jgi:hypothetical protein